MLAMNGGITVRASITSAVLFSVHRKASVGLDYSTVVVEISGWMGTIHTLTSFPVTSIRFDSKTFRKYNVSLPVAADCTGITNGPVSAHMLPLSYCIRVDMVRFV